MTDRNLLNSILCGWRRCAESVKARRADNDLLEESIRYLRDRLEKRDEEILELQREREQLRQELRRLGGQP